MVVLLVKNSIRYLIGSGTTPCPYIKKKHAGCQVQYIIKNYQNPA